MERDIVVKLSLLKVVEFFLTRSEAIRHLPYRLVEKSGLFVGGLFSSRRPKLIMHWEEIMNLVDYAVLLLVFFERCDDLCPVSAPEEGLKVSLLGLCHRGRWLNAAWHVAAIAYCSHLVLGKALEACSCGLVTHVCLSFVGLKFFG